MLNYPLLYLEHLTERDVGLIAASVAGLGDSGSLRARLGEKPELIDDLLAEPVLYDAVFDQPDPVISTGVSPFLAFGILVNRAGRDLEAATYVSEWAGPGKRLPVFDVETMREFVEEGTRRYFLIEFLASFTRVASGTRWVKTRKGYRRRRYSELDLVRLAELVEELPAGRRSAGYRRLGDVALFLSGLFPDHTARHPLSPLERLRLSRSAAIDPEEALTDDDLAFFESAGTAWYHRAVDSAAAAVGVGPRFLHDVADRFSPARRVLNYLTDRYLYRLDTGLAQPGN